MHHTQRPWGHIVIHSFCMQRLKNVLYYSDSMRNNNKQADKQTKLDRPPHQVHGHYNAIVGALISTDANKSTQVSSSIISTLLFVWVTS